MNKQIEEMAKVVNEMDERNAHYYDKFMQECEAFADADTIAKVLYNAGYRKQSEGEWVYNTDDFTPKQRCTVCGYNKPILAGEGVIQEPKHFCPNCGARMRKEDEGK